MKNSRNNIKKKQEIKIPKNIGVFYWQNKNVIIFKSYARQKLIRINELIHLNCKKHHIAIKTNKVKQLSNIEKKMIHATKKTTLAIIKIALVEVLALTYQKLKFVGVGYRVFPVENFENHLLLLQLGYSHPVYFRVPQRIKTFTLKFTKLFLWGHSHQMLTSIATQIRHNKLPEPYKGKGILYDTEVIVLKEGKKT